MNYHNKRFKSIQNSESGEVDAETIFHYRQGGSTLWATYRGGSIQFGTIIGKVDENGNIDMRYQHLSDDGTFKTGECLSTPEILANGKIRLHEVWQWTSGTEGKGQSIIEEV